MITEQERDTIKQGLDNILFGLNQLLSMCDLFESKNFIINKLIFKKTKAKKECDFVTDFYIED